MIKVLICDDQVMVREGLKTILNNAEAGIEVVGLAHDGAHALELIPQSLPDVILMDLKMPIMNGIDATINALKLKPEIKIIALTMFNEDEYIQSMIDAGVKGFLIKNINKEKQDSELIFEDFIPDNFEYIRLDNEFN